MAREHLPDPILLDLMMPIVTGFDVVNALRANDLTRHIPIVVLTAKDLTAEDKAALAGHTGAVLRKGTMAAVELVAWLNRVLDQAAARRE